MSGKRDSCELEGKVGIKNPPGANLPLANPRRRKHRIRVMENGAEGPRGLILMGGFKNCSRGLRISWGSSREALGFFVAASPAIFSDTSTNGKCPTALEHCKVRLPVPPPPSRQEVPGQVGKA